MTIADLARSAKCLRLEALGVLDHDIGTEAQRRALVDAADALCAQVEHLSAAVAGLWARDLYIRLGVATPPAPIAMERLL